MSTVHPCLTCCDPPWRAHDRHRTAPCSRRPLLLVDRPNAADTAKLARDHVARLPRHNGHAELADTARLLTSEIVTNAFAHTTVLFVTVETTIDAGHVLVAVYDASPRLPEPRAAVAESDETGRGLLLVQLLADDWGVNGGRGGKRTWFELRAAARQ